ncbi:MAG TPA: aldolase/citrate lyase family protein [Jiangellaceae bacterium]
MTDRMARDHRQRPAATLGSDVLAELDGMLAGADADLARLYPGDVARRQPVHTVYVPADRIAADTVRTWGAAALDALATHGADAAALAAAVGLPADVVAEVLPLVHRKLSTEPIEDLRIDFEDGLGVRPDDEEDDLAQAAARAVADASITGHRPPFVGIRFKSLEAPNRLRGVRTLHVFLDALLAAGSLPDGLVVTLPKVTSVAQVEAMGRLCERLESAYGLPGGRLRFEVQIETPQAIIGADGVATVARIVHAVPGRLTGLHYGTYDYSAACGVAAAYQSLEHPAADYAKAVMQVATAGTGVRLSDGSTNVLPVGDTTAVRAAWALHARLIRRSLERGFYQGWDLHPAQLPTRFLATYVFYRSGFAAAANRLTAYAARRDSGVLDEPATARALAGFLVRGLECGAITEDDLHGYDLDRTLVDGYAGRAAAP